MSSLVRTDPWSLFDFAPNLLRFDWSPAALQSIKVEHFRDGDSLVIRAELPGIDPERDVSITLSDNMLHIEAERTDRKEHTDADGYRSEFRYGAFSRDLRVPAGISQSDIVATYADGILEVRVPVPREKPPATIPVTRAHEKP